MADDIASESNNPSGNAPTSSEKRRTIKGALPYVSASGAVTTILNKIVEAETPDKFTSDFLETKLSAKGGSARAVIPLLKRLGLLESNGTPTELYNQFRSEVSRSQAMLRAIRHGYSELFARNEFANELTDEKLKSLIIEITGLPINDNIVGYIKNTFRRFTAFIEKDEKLNTIDTNKDSGDSIERLPDEAQSFTKESLGLIYNINIVLPETDDVKVLNAIFQSLKRNLLLSND